MGNELIMLTINKQYDEQRRIYGSGRQALRPASCIKRRTGFYDYEKEFIKIWEDLGREVFEKNINTVGPDRRKKKLAVASGK
jgi:hypothetical protein